MYKIIDGDYGKHAIATKDIEKDTIVLEENPSIICEDLYDAIYKLYNSESEFEDLQDKFEEMTPHKLDKHIISCEELDKEIKMLPEYMQQFFKNIEKTKLRLYAAKYYRNGFNYNIDYGGPTAILFQGNLFNHSCDPNINFEIEKKTGKYIFIANKLIKKNEELVDNYININLPYIERQTRLLHQYGFKCKCIKCCK